jgi:hypothetical protein
MTGGGTGASDDCIRIPTPGRQTGYKRASMRIVLRVASAIAQLSFSTFHYTGLGSYDVTDRGYTTGPDVDFIDLTGTWAATEMPMDSEAGSFAITAVNGGTISGSIGATMEDVTAPAQSAGMVSAGGSFTVPLQTAP